MTGSYLVSFPDRIASDGQELVTHRFPGGVIALASPLDLKPQLNPLAGRRCSFWSGLGDLLGLRTTPSVHPVRILPGTRLLVRDIPEALQDEMGVSWSEKVVFTEIATPAGTYRDGIRFLNGREILLQRLQEGQRVRVLDSSAVQYADPAAEPLVLLAS
jgi:hypothetical protein